MMRRAAITVLCVATSAAAEQTQPPDLMQLTGNQYEQLFEGDQETHDMGLMIFAKRVTEESNALPVHVICWPQGSTYVQGAKVVSAFMRNNPQFLNYRMRELVSASLIQTFPCR